MIEEPGGKELLCLGVVDILGTNQAEESAPSFDLHAATTPDRWVTCAPSIGPKVAHNSLIRLQSPSRRLNLVSKHPNELSDGFESRVCTRG